MSTPKRIQRRRVKDWRKPPGAVDCTRPGPFGNPFKVTEERTPGECKIAFRTWLEVDGCTAGMASRKQYILEHLHELRDRDLVCWCRLCDKHTDGLPLGVHCPHCAPCHVDVYLEVANR